MIQQIGKYKILRELGRGGFGYVYLALDQAMDRQVAVKILTEVDDPSVIARFRTEAVAAGNLHHRNIVIIHDFGEDQQRHYLVMEYLAGRDLQQIIAAKEPLPLWQKVDVMSQIAEGLYCAHQHGVLHRDVKPANMMVLGDGTVKILDFGIARLTERDSTRLTRSGFLVGTPLYMSPELLNAGTVDELSDIWSYGTIFYELLTGRHPFAAQDTASLMYRIMNTEPEPISSLAPDCPEALSRVVSRLLAKQREFRYQSLAEVQYDTAPLLREMKRQQATGLLAGAAGMIESGKLDEAQAVIRSVLDLDAGNTEAGRLRDRVRQILKQRALRPKLDALLETAEGQAARRNYPAAIQAMERACGLDPDDASLASRLAVLRQAQAQSETVQRCLSEARQQLELQNLTEAFKYATGAVNADPADANAGQLLQQIQSDIAQRDRERNVQMALNRAKSLLVMETFDEAIELLQKADRDWPGSERVEDLLRQAQRQKAEKEAREKVAAAVAAARNLIRKRSFAEAIASLESLSREFPADSEVAGLLAFARDELAGERRAAAVEQMVRDSRTLTKKGEFDAAVHTVEQGLETYPGDETLMRALQAALGGKAEHEKNRKLQEGIDRCRRMREQGAVNDALELTVVLEREISGSLELTRLREELQRDSRQAEDRRLAAERKAAAERDIAALLADASRKAEAGDLAGALKALEDGLVRFPGASGLRAAAEDLRKKKGASEAARQVDAACEKIQRLLDASQLDAAAECLARARRDHPADPRFDAFDAQLQEAVAREAHFWAAQEKIRVGAYDDAERELHAILDRNQQDTGARNLLATVARQRAAAQQKQRYDSGRAEAERLLRERQFDAALKVLETLLKEFPADSLLEENARIAREAKQRVSRGEAVSRGRAAAEEFLRAKNFASAIRVLDDLHRRFPDDIPVADDLKAAVAAQQDHDRKQAYAAGRAEAERLLAARDFPGAILKYQGLLRDFPNDPLLLDALHAAEAAQQHYRRKEEAARGRAEAERLMRDRKMGEAIALLESLVKKFPDEVTIADDLRNAIEARDQSQRTQALMAGRAEAEQLAARRAFDPAINRYNALLKEFPGDGPLMEGLASVKAAKAAAERKQVYTAGRAEAERLARELKFDAALKQLDDLQREFPQDRALEEDRESVLAAQQSRGERLRIDKQLAQLEKLYRKGDAAAVKESAAHLLTEAQSPRAKELLDWAEATLKRKAQPPVVADDRTARPAGRSKLVLLAAALPAVLVAAAGLVYWNSQSHKSSLAVSPGQVVFAWKQGTALPPARSVTVKSEAPWTLSTSDEWLTAKRVPDDQGQDVAIAVVPAQLAAGVYSGVLLISEGGATAKVNVKLTVESNAPKPAVTEKQEPPKPTQQAKQEPPPPQPKAEPKKAVDTPPAEPPITERPVDCKGASYSGLLTSDLRWSGELPPNGTLLVGRGKVTLAGQAVGTWSGTPLPGCEVTFPQKSAGIEIVEPPSAANNFSRLRVRNVSGTPLSSFSLRWQIK